MGTNAHIFAPSLHRVVIFADVAQFSAPHRTEGDRLTIRTDFYNAMRSAFADTGVFWDDCQWEDRGDGALILVPPEYGEGTEELLLKGLPQLLASALRQYEQERPSGSRFQLRMAIHVGEVHSDDRGYLGETINHAARLLDAMPLKRALQESAVPLALIVSDALYHGTIQNAPSLEPANYQRVVAPITETSATGWVRLFDQAPEASPAGSRETPHAGRVNGEKPVSRCDTEGFDGFYLAHYRFVRNTINARAQDWTLAEEVANEAMAIAYRKWNDLVEHPNAIGFVIVTARRILSRIQRQRARKAQIESTLSLDVSPGLELSAPGGDPADIIVNRTALQHSLKALPVDQRECFVLHEILGQSVRQIAELLNLPEGTVKTRLRAARQALRELLDDDLREGGVS